MVYMYIDVVAVNLLCLYTTVFQATTGSNMVIHKLFVSLPHVSQSLCMLMGLTIIYLILCKFIKSKSI